MPLRVLIAPDKFKATLPARDAAEAMARGWSGARPGDALDLVPITDGGDGFGEVMGGLLRANSQVVETVDAAHRPCRAKWWWEPRTGTALIESAAIIGLAMLPPGKFHPFGLDTFGLGAALSAAAQKGARRCIVGIGGSATNDGGFGLARALGWQFLDRAGNSIESWTGLCALRDIRAPRRRWFHDLRVAVDVSNPLLGTRGATRVYGPQKGLEPRDLVPAERCLRRLARVAQEQLGRDFARVPGAGAAGGLGFGLAAFAGARLEPGFSLFAQLAGLERHLGSADLVLTGEGALDRSTLMGKGLGQLVQRCRDLGIPCVVLAGMSTLPRKQQSVFAGIYSLSEMTSSQSAKADPEFWLERLARKVAQGW